MKKNSQTAITAPNAELGSGLVAEAQAQYNKQRQEKVVAAVRQVVQWRDEAEQTMLHCERRKAYFAKVLAALESGEFTIHAQQIVFTDKKLTLNPGGEFWQTGTL